MLELSGSSLVVFNLRAEVGAAVVGNISLQLWVAPGMVWQSHGPDIHGLCFILGTSQKKG